MIIEVGIVPLDPNPLVSIVKCSLSKVKVLDVIHIEFVCAHNLDFTSCPMFFGLQ